MAKIVNFLWTVNFLWLISWKISFPFCFASYEWPNDYFFLFQQMLAATMPSLRLYMRCRCICNYWTNLLMSTVVHTTYLSLKPSLTWFKKLNVGKSRLSASKLFDNYSISTEIRLWSPDHFKEIFSLEQYKRALVE